MSDDRSRARKVRGWLVGAAITGVLAGVSRAVTSWLLDHLPSGW
jgi:hypothetical protein